MLMSIVSCIPPRRRDRLYGEIQRIVGEVAAADRALEGLGEGMAIDEALEEIAELLSGELTVARRRSRRVARSA